ncbi:MAG TPA: potassium-transporting ATPase subunit KdpC [Cellulomonadaceae bacterium]|nr:potassium-transporting ATPase subunit KdpC [Cellulomonadaceae bacterium]
MTRTSSLPAPVRQHLAALRVLLVLTVVTGVLYPLALTAVGRLMAGRADGSLLQHDGKTVGSSLLGQPFTTADGDALPQWFQVRPGGYDPLASGASNLGPNNPDLVRLVKQRRAAVAAADGVPTRDVPPDALTASGSGLDPDISPAYAYEQVDRVAKARGLDPEAVRRLVRNHVQGRALGVLGEPRVNVLELNLALLKLAAGR